MTLTDEDRAKIAERVRSRREVVFNTLLAAYTAAGINSETWGRIERGERVRADRLRAALHVLWPYSDGRPETILTMPDTPMTATLANLADLSDDDLLGEVRRRMIEGRPSTSPVPDSDRIVTRGNTDRVITSVKAKSHAVTKAVVPGKRLPGAREHSERDAVREAKAAKDVRTEDKTERDDICNAGRQHR